MKLQTMLLPTGEFVLILSEAPEAYADWAEDFKNRTGAAAMLVTTEDVEVVDTLFDENARRHEAEIEDVTSGPLTFDESWVMRDDILNEIQDNLNRGIDYTPAGLVNTAEHPEARSTAQLEPELEAALAGGLNPDTTSTEQDDCGCYPRGVVGPMCNGCPLTGQETRRGR